MRITSEDGNDPTFPRGYLTTARWDSRTTKNRETFRVPAYASILFNLYATHLLTTVVMRFKKNENIIKADWHGRRLSRTLSD